MTTKEKDTCMTHIVATDENVLLTRQWQKHRKIRNNKMLAYLIVSCNTAEGGIGHFMTCNEVLTNNEVT